MMNLGYMRRHLREMLKEPDPDNSLWTDLTLNEWLNEGARMMSASAQQEESVFQFNCGLVSNSLTAYQREHILPDDFESVLSASLWNGNEQRLTYRDTTQSIRNNEYVGIPAHFYIRERTRKRIDTSASGITVSDADQKKRPRKMFGLDPCPNAAFLVTITYISAHRWMRTDGDEPNVPYEFRRGIIEYAAAQAFKSDEMYAQANLALGEYAAYTEKLRDKQITKGHETEFPVTRIRDDEDSDFFYEVSRVP